MRRMRRPSAGFCGRWVRPNSRRYSPNTSFLAPSCPRTLTHDPAAHATDMQTSASSRLPSCSTSRPTSIEETWRTQSWRTRTTRRGCWRTSWAGWTGTTRSRSRASSSRTSCSRSPGRCSRSTFCRHVRLPVARLSGPSPLRARQRRATQRACTSAVSSSVSEKRASAKRPRYRYVTALGHEQKRAAPWQRVWPEPHRKIPQCARD